MYKNYFCNSLFFQLFPLPISKNCPAISNTLQRQKKKFQLLTKNKFSDILDFLYINLLFFMFIPSS
jgi:hypothetical protein